MNKSLAISLVMLFFPIIFLPTYYFAVQLPVEYQYNQQFHAPLDATLSMSDFSSIKANVVQVYSLMNQTFKGQNPYTTYSTVFWWDKTYTHSLAYQSAQFHALIQRIDYYQNLFAQQNNKTLLQDTYTQALNNVKCATGFCVLSSSGAVEDLPDNVNIDDGLQGMWFLSFNPFAWWFGYLAILLFISFLLGLILLLVG